MLVSEILNPKKNNFDLFRLIAALLVIYGHAWAFVPSAPNTDFVARLLGFEYSGSLAVKFFFLLSGFLVTSSLLTKPYIFDFLFKRAARIFPGLVTCLILTVFVVGLVFTKLPIIDYLTNPQSWKYLINNSFLYQLEWTLPGVFTDSKYGVNGSLWTLPLEVICYLFLAAFFGIGIWRATWIANTALVAIIILSFFAPEYFPGYWSNNKESHLLPGCFALGGLFATNQSKINVNTSGLFSLAIITALLWGTGFKIFFFYLCFFYSCLYLGSRVFVVEKLRMPIDPSYGVYIYGFVTQQALAHWLPGKGIIFNQVVAALIALALGIGSWLLIEKPAIQWARKAIANKDQATHLIVQSLDAIKKSIRNIAGQNAPIILILVLVAWAMHFLSLYFIFPGHYTPLAFHHSDFYIPASFAYAPGDGYSFANLLHWPRPLFMWFYKFTGYFGHAGSVAWVVGIVFLNAALSALLAKHWLKLKFDKYFVIYFALYCYLLFTQPFFYTFYSQDIGSQLSYFLLLSGSLGFFLVSKQNLTVATTFLFLCSTCAFLVKETYFLAFGLIYFCWFLYFIKYNPLKAIAPGTAVFIAGVISALVNLKTKSVFVNLDASAGSSYQISIDPISVLKELGRYFSEGITPALILALGLIIYQVHKAYKNRMLTFGSILCVAFAFMAWLPNSLLPNHHYEGYSFNGLYISFLLLFFILKMQQDNIKIQPILITLLILVALSPLTSIKKYHGTRNTWVLAMEQVQTNMLAGFNHATSSLKATTKPTTVLITGITSPFHPFSFAQSIRSFPNGEKANYIFVVPNEFPNNVGTKIDLVQFISAGEEKNWDYDQEWQFDQQGNLVSIKGKNSGN